MHQISKLCAVLVHLFCLGVSVWGASYNLPSCGIFLCLLPKQRAFWTTKLRSEYKKDMHPQNQARKKVQKFPFQSMLEPSPLFPTTSSIPNQKRLSNIPEGGRYKQVGLSGVILPPIFAIRYAHSEDRHKARRTPSGGQKDSWPLLHHCTDWAFDAKELCYWKYKGKKGSEGWRLGTDRGLGGASLKEFWGAWLAESGIAEGNY